MPKVTELKYVKTNHKKLKTNHTQVLPGKSQPSISSLIPMPAGRPPLGIHSDKLGHNLIKATDLRGVVVHVTLKNLEEQNHKSTLAQRCDWERKATAYSLYFRVSDAALQLRF